MSAELLQLNHVRLDQDLSFQELGNSLGLSEATVRRLLTTPNPRLYERTLYKIRRFLDGQKTAEKSPRRRQAVRA